MKLKRILYPKSMLLAFIALLLSVQSMYAQDALTSVRFTVKNLRLSPDKKVISYDVYLKDVDNEYEIAVPGFTFRLMMPMADLGTQEKIAIVNNGTLELGAASATMIPSGSNWLMKFNQKTVALKYSDALILSSVGDGTLVGTFNIANKDGSCFSINQPFNVIYSGAELTKKSTVAILKPNTIRLAVNSTTALPESSTVGLGVHNLATSLDGVSKNNLTIFPNPTTNGFNINVGDTPSILNISDVKGERLLTKQVQGKAYIDISRFTNGVYLVEINGVRTKLVKK